jgi:hypothetical protein
MERGVKLPDRNDSTDRRSQRINQRHQALDQWQFRQNGMTDMNHLLRAACDHRQVRPLAVVDHHSSELAVIEAKIQQVEFPVTQRGIDDQ